MNNDHLRGECGTVSPPLSPKACTLRDQRMQAFKDTIAPWKNRKYERTKPSRDVPRFHAETIDELSEDVVGSEVKV